VQQQLSNANFLNFDATSGELAYRKLERSNFNMKVGQSSLRSVLLNGAYPITENLEVYAFGVLVIEKVKQQVFIEDQISQELILIQMVSYLKPLYY
jgi:hypothetical protein